MAGSAEARVDVWYVNPALVGAARVEELRQVLSPIERERAERYARAPERTRFVVTRALLRLTLARHLGVPPSALHFTCNAFGKPSIAAPAAAAGLHFNLSHTDGLSLCVVAQREVGIDVEHTARDAPLELAERWFTRDERQELDDCPPQTRADRFFQYWTLKEAYIKARGHSLVLLLHQVSIRWAGQVIELSLAPECDDDEQSWLPLTWRATLQHRAALVVRRSQQPIELCVRPGLDDAEHAAWLFEHPRL